MKKKRSLISRTVLAIVHTMNRKSRKAAINGSKLIIILKILKLFLKMMIVKENDHAALENFNMTKTNFILIKKIKNYSYTHFTIMLS